MPTHQPTPWWAIAVVMAMFVAAAVYGVTKARATLRRRKDSGQPAPHLSAARDITLSVCGLLFALIPLSAAVAPGWMRPVAYAIAFASAAHAVLWAAERVMAWQVGRRRERDAQALGMPTLRRRLSPQWVGGIAAAAAFVVALMVIAAVSSFVFGQPHAGPPHLVLLLASTVLAGAVAYRQQARRIARDRQVYDAELARYLGDDGSGGVMAE